MSYENIRHKDVVAKKRHTCDWCNRAIEKGETYHYEVFKYDGEFCEWHSHLACSRVVSAIWDYVDPDEGMDSDQFDEGCADVCREFICPDCEHFSKEYGECEKDESYCIDRMDEFFKTQELYATKDGYYRVWRCREKENAECT